MTWLQSLLCLLFGHKDVRLVSANPRDGAMYRCLGCNAWWIEKS